MALDYSKLSEEELKAIAAGDYSRLSDATLQQLASESSAQTQPQSQTQPYTTQSEADRNELLGLGALGAGALGAGALAYKFGPQIIDVAKQYTPSGRLASKAIDVAKNVMARPPVSTPTAPVAPPPAPTTSPILDAQGRPMVRTPPATGPVAPAPTTGPMPPGATAGSAPLRPPAQPGIMDRASQIVRQLAANRAVQGAARLGGGAAALLMPGNIGQDYPFPTTGPLRGSEINPNTGRPWTKEELAAYRAQYGR